MARQTKPSAGKSEAGATEPTKAAAKKPAKTARKSPAKTAAKSPAKAAIRTPDTAPAKTTAKDTVKTPASAVRDEKPKVEAPKVDQKPSFEEKAKPAEASAKSDKKPAETKPATGKKPEPTGADLVPLADTGPPPTDKGGIMPMVLGGVVAAAIGFGAAYFALPKGDGQPGDIAQRLDRQAEMLGALNDKVDALPVGPDLSGIEAAQVDSSAAIAALSDRLGGLQNRLGELDNRLTTLEKRPIAVGASDTAVAAYARDLEALQAALNDQQNQFEAIAVEAAVQEQSAGAEARATLRRVAIARIWSALDTGSGFLLALNDLEATGVEPPDALINVAGGGVASLAMLQDSFPDAARAALTAVRAAAPETGEGGLMSFMRDQLGARSLEPREGNDPDAILSRAEAATGDGRLNDALAEIETLPEVGRAAFTDWAGEVDRRLNAMAAAGRLGDEFN